jgi:Tol biopolymer transport system component
MTDLNAATMRNPAQTSATSAMRTMQTTAMRPKTVGIIKRKERINRALLILLYVVSVAGAAWGAWTIANKMNEPKGEVAFRRITFRRGEVRGARFAPDGDTIIYSATWEGRPVEVFIANRRSPEARPLGIPDADILAVSRSTELAILMRRDRLTGFGTLARVPLAGGMPREIADNVLQADWSPDGQLAIIRAARNRYRLEYPIGTVKYETQHYIRDLRVSPDGKSIAFIEPHGGANDLVVVRDGPNPDPIARGWANGATGLSWSPDGSELWITGTDSSDPPSLYAVKLSGERRLISRLTGSMKLFDISPQGRALLSNGMWRAALLHQPPGESMERDMSWLDWSMLADVSPDGKSILFNETREGGGNRKAIYLRRISEPAPVHLGDGQGDGLSPDGRWILAHAGQRLMLLPTGSGDARELKVQANFDFGAAWLPDSRRVIIGGAMPKGGYQLLLVDTLDETVKPISPENIWGNSWRPFAVSSDSRYVAGMTADETIALYPIDGGQPIPVSAAEKGEVPISWSADNSAIYVYRPNALPARVIRINLASGARDLWKEFSPADPAGIYKISPVMITPNGSSYAYNALRTTSDLYVAEGLH